VGPLAAPAGQHPAGGGSDGQRIELAHGPRRDPRAGQGAEARAPIGAVAFPPRLGWREVPIHRPTQGRPLPPRARPVMAPMAQPQPKVPPAPRGADPRQPPGAAPLASVRRGPVRAERRRPSAALRRRRPPPQPPARGRGVGGIKRPPPQQRRRFRIRPPPAGVPVPRAAPPLPPHQHPRLPPVAPLRPGQGGPAGRAAPPRPGLPGCAVPPPWANGVTPFAKVHGRGHHGASAPAIVAPRPASSRPLPPAYPPLRTNTLSAPTRRGPPAGLGYGVQWAGARTQRAPTTDRGSC
jgi:hypothetical protein